MADQAFEVGAVDGGVAEAVVCAIAVCVVAAAAHGQQRAGAAGGGERVGPRLAGGHAGVAQRVVEGVVEDVEAGGGGAVVRGLERVDLFDGPVRLDDHRVERVEAEGLCCGGQSEEQRDALLEQPDVGLPPGGPPPAVEDGAQPVAVRGGAARSGGFGQARRRAGPVAVGQQEVQGRRAQGEQ